MEVPESKVLEESSLFRSPNRDEVAKPESFLSSLDESWPVDCRFVFPVVEVGTSSSGDHKGFQLGPRTESGNGSDCRGRGFNGLVVIAVCEGELHTTVVEEWACSRRRFGVSKRFREPHLRRRLSQKRVGSVLALCTSGLLPAWLLLTQLLQLLSNSPFTTGATRGVVVRGKESLIVSEAVMVFVAFGSSLERSTADFRTPFRTVRDKLFDDNSDLIDFYSEKKEPVHWSQLLRKGKSHRWYIWTFFSTNHRLGDLGRIKPWWDSEIRNN